ncbi:MAG: hypothetical protein HQL30_07840 [Candidatus Omnitrophica bacterium]|nr:hypothetical protein [Candidatus Omnitrophota bacterium]
MKYIIFSKKWPAGVLIAICLASVLLALPTIGNNISDPNMIVYMDTDEGSSMDTIWSYYSGQRSASFQWDYDYGLFWMYVADIWRMFLSKYFVCTPGTLVFFLRWVHLLSWVGALVALWNLVGRHFRTGWPQVLCVGLLASRPDYAYLLNNLKPDPLFLLIEMIGLDYALRVIGKPSTRDLLTAVWCGSAAAVIKYFLGVFLIVPAVSSIYLSKRLFARNGSGRLGKVFIYREIKQAFLLPAIIGGIVLAALAGSMAFYVRKSTGMTWCAEFGVMGTLRNNVLMRYILFAGVLLTAVSALLWSLNRIKRESVRVLMARISEVNSYFFLVSALFIGGIAVFGFRWLIVPKQIIQVYVPLCWVLLGQGALRLIPEEGLLKAFIGNVAGQIMAFGPIILLLFITYCSAEITLWRKGIIPDRTAAYKRYVLASFLAVPFAIMFSMLHMAHHHMLPFYTVASILAVEGAMIMAWLLSGNTFARNAVIGLIAICFAAHLAGDSYAMVGARLSQYKQGEDAAFEIGKWFKTNVPSGAKIAASHYIDVYIPPGYNNVRTVRHHTPTEKEDFRELINEYDPDIVYYNEKDHGISLEDVLPAGRSELVKVFDSRDYGYVRRKGDRFLIYRIKH